MSNRDIRAFKILFWILFPICFFSFIRKPSLQLGLWCFLFVFVLAPVVFNLKGTNKSQIDATTEGINLTSKDWPLFSVLGFILPLIATILSWPTTTFSSLFLFGAFSFIGVIAAISFLACKNALGNKTHEK